MSKIALILLLSCLSYSVNAQRLKYKSDIEPILLKPKSLDKIRTLEMYYQQNLGPDKKPTAQAISTLKDRMGTVCMYAGTELEAEARKLKDYPTTDSAVALLYAANAWYSRSVNEYFVKNDTLKAHILKNEALLKTWKATEQQLIKAVLTEKNKLSENLDVLESYDPVKAKKFRETFKNHLYLNEYKEANKEIEEYSRLLLKNLEVEKKMEEQRIQAALEKKSFLIAQQENERKQREFLNLQSNCAQENPCPACPLDIALKFREAYYAGDIDKMKSMIVDYYGDGIIFYDTKIDIFQNLNADDERKLKLQIRAKTADYKITEPAGTVYFTDNETKDFFIDKNYKSYRLHATVFQAINDFDKIDLIKYNGEWKVYRVGGAYSGRSGKTIITGRFFFDQTFLQKEIKIKKK